MHKWLSTCLLAAAEGLVEVCISQLLHALAVVKLATALTNARMMTKGKSHAHDGHPYQDDSWLKTG